MQQNERGGKEKKRKGGAGLELKIDPRIKPKTAFLFFFFGDDDDDNNKIAQ